MRVELGDATPTGPYEYRWPDSTESFERGWEGILVADGRQLRFQHRIGGRHVYDRQRVHTVTWLDGVPAVEGVAADDYDRTRALLSRIKRPDGKLARSPAEVPPGYDGLLIVSHRGEIDAPYSPRGLAVKVREDDLQTWGLLAVLRAQVHGRKSGKVSDAPLRVTRAPFPFDTIPREQQLVVVRQLIRHDEEINGPLRQGTAKLTSDGEADRFVHENAFAFLLAVLFDQGIPFGRAWRAPLELRARLGHLDPRLMLLDTAAVADKIRQKPALHRYVNKMPRWVIDACRRIVDDYGGDAESIWSDRPTARELQARLCSLVGISQKKAAMTVMLLWRNCNTEIREMEGCDVAVDIHVRRVFLRTGLVERDDPRAMIEAARELWPKLPGALDPPTWMIGRNYCHATEPDCPHCPLTSVCPQLKDRAASVAGP